MFWSPYPSHLGGRDYLTKGLLTWNSQSTALAGVLVMQKRVRCITREPINSVASGSSLKHAEQPGRKQTAFLLQFSLGIMSVKSYQTGCLRTINRARQASSSWL